jgi:hypothetical protein
VFQNPNHSTFEIKHYIIRDEVRKGESGSPIHISTDKQISRHFDKASVQDERACVLKLELVETTSLLKKEEMTPRLGGSTDVLLIDGYDEQILSSSESGLKFLTDKHFLVRKWSRLLMYHRQRLPIVVNMGSGLGQSLFLRVTQEDWPALSDNDFSLWLT